MATDAFDGPTSRSSTLENAGRNVSLIFELNKLAVALYRAAVRWLFPGALLDCFLAPFLSEIHFIL